MSWTFSAAYIAHRLRARLPGRALTGLAGLAGLAVTGTGTAFSTELSVGAWLRFAVSPDRAFQVTRINSDTSAETANGAIIGESAMSVLLTDVHDQNLRAAQGDERVLVRLIGSRPDPSKPQDQRVQFLISASSEGRLRELTDQCRTAFPDSSFFMQSPNGGPALRVLWSRIETDLPLGETDTGRFERSLNFIMRGI